MSSRSRWRKSSGKSGRNQPQSSAGEYDPLQAEWERQEAERERWIDLHEKYGHLFEHFQTSESLPLAGVAGGPTTASSLLCGSPQTGAVPPTSGTGGSSQHGRGTGGFDKLEASLYCAPGSFGGVSYHQVSRELLDLQEAAKQPKAPKQFYSNQGAIWRVHEAGARAMGRYFHHRLEFDDVTLILTGTPDQKSDRWGRVVIGSSRLMRDGIATVWNDVLEKLKELRVEYIRSTWSLADLATDLPGANPDFAAKAISEGRCIRRSQHVDLKYTGQALNVYIGQKGGDKIYLRLYEKLRDLAENPDDYKEYIYRMQRLGHADVKQALRAEFSVGGQAIRDKFDNVKSVEQLIIMAPALLRYLCEDWIRFTKEVPDKKNKHHARYRELDPVWDEVCSLATMWTGEDYVELTRAKPMVPKRDNLRAQQRGVTAKEMALTSKRFRSAEEVQRYLMEEVYNLAECESLMRKCKENRKDLVTKGYHKVMSVPGAVCAVGCTCLDCVPADGELFDKSEKPAQTMPD